jgi:hypothetical protein
MNKDNIMNDQDSDKIIGYSGFILFEACYEYNENACFIADNEKLAKEFMDNCGHSTDDYRVDKIRFADILKDYGCSSGEYAMEPKAFSIFKEIAGRTNMKYEAEKYDFDSSLTVVEIEGL